MLKTRRKEAPGYGLQMLKGRSCDLHLLSAKEFGCQHVPSCVLRLYCLWVSYSVSVLANVHELPNREPQPMQRLGHGVDAAKLIQRKLHLEKAIYHWSIYHWYHYPTYLNSLSTLKHPSNCVVQLVTQLCHCLQPFSTYEGTRCLARNLNQVWALRETYVATYNFWTKA